MEDPLTRVGDRWLTILVPSQMLSWIRIDLQIPAAHSTVTISDMQRSYSLDLPIITQPPWSYTDFDHEVGCRIVRRVGGKSSQAMFDLCQVVEWTVRKTSVLPRIGLLPVATLVAKPSKGNFGSN
jgi:hypothetical protein